VRQRSQTLSVARQLYPPAGTFRTFRASALDRISEEASVRPRTSDGVVWERDSGRTGRVSPTLSTAQYSTASSFSPDGAGRTKHPVGRKDVIENIGVFDHLAETSRKYEEAMRALSEVSVQFADALEQCSRTKELSPEDEEDDVVEDFRSLSGYHYYVASQQRALAHLFHAQCTDPLVRQSAAYRNALIVTPVPISLT
jgi:hypothetical protein